MVDLLESKVRLSIPEFIHLALASDESDFSLNKNKLCNRIFEVYAEEIIADQDQIKTQFNRILQFNLNKENQDRFVGIDANSKINNKAEYFRKIFLKYCNQAKYQREKDLFSASVTLLEYAIQHQLKLKIKYKNAYRTIEPYFIINSDGETRNYVFCYCEKRQSYCNYRLLNIHAIAILKDSQKHHEAEYINAIKANFDAFLSYGKVVKVRLNPSGQQILATHLTHRPKLLEQHEDIFSFECSELKAQLYFPQFMQHAEILEPTTLRTWFKDNFAKVATLYQSTAN